MRWARKNDPAVDPKAKADLSKKSENIVIAFSCLFLGAVGIIGVLAILNGDDWSASEQIHFTVTPHWHNSPENQPGIALTLPDGWRMRYNASQKWRSGTVVGREANPQIEVTLYPYAGTYPARKKLNLETTTLPTGKVEFRKYFYNDDESGRDSECSYDFFIGDHILGFKVRKGDDEKLRPVIWQILETARLTGE